MAQHVWAQPRKLSDNEDQVWRSRVVSRLDLLNRVNVVLSQGQPKDVYIRTDRHERYQDGIVSSLLTAFSLNKMPGYMPYSLEEYTTYDAVMQLTATMVTLPQLSPASEMSDSDESVDWMADDVFETDMPDETSDASPAPVVDIKDPTVKTYLWMGYGTALEIIYDEVFSSRTSSVEFVPLYIRLVLITESEPYVDRPMVAFRYADVEHLLTNTFVYSPHDDAHPYNCHDLIMMRLFDSIDLNIRGAGQQSLLEAERHRLQGIQFEHNLWSY